MTSPLTLPIAKFFGTGEPGWMTRDVPPGTHLNLEAGRCGGPAGSLVRSPSIGKWARVG